MNILRTMGCPSFNYGSQEKYIVELAKNCRKAGHKIFVVYENYPTNKDFLKAADEAGIAFFVVKPRRLLQRFIPKSFVLKFIKSWYDLFDFFALIRILKIIHSEKIDIVHSYFSPSLYSNFAAKLSDKKNFRTIGNPYLQPAIIQGKKIDLLFNIKCYMFYIFPISLINKMICISNQIRDEFLEWSIKSDKLEVITSGVNPDFWKPSSTMSLRNELKVEGKYIIGFTGRLEQQKNLFFLLDYFKLVSKKIEKAVLVLIGSGSLEKLLKLRVKELKLSNKVFFMGRRHDIKSLVNDFDLFVLPSLFEGMPSSLLEAMSLEKPCLVSNIAMFKEIINSGENGLICENLTSYCDATNLVYKDRALSGRLGKNARLTILDHFNASKRYQKEMQLYGIE